MKKLVSGVCAVVLAFTICAMLAWASPAVGVTPTLIGRATYEPFSGSAADGQNTVVERRMARRQLGDHARRRSAVGDYPIDRGAFKHGDRVA